MTGDLLYSVIVPVYNDPIRLWECLRALAAQSLQHDRFEVIVVDNGSAESPQAVVREHGFARLLFEPVAGSYNARNTACRSASGRYLAFTDSDCRPHSEWLAEGLHYFETHPEVAAIGGRIALDRSTAPSAAEFYERVYAFRQDRYVDQYGFAATANLIVRRDAFEAVGPFDGVRKSGGDLEWGQRLGAAGYAIRYADQVVVSHPARADLRALVLKRRRLTGGHYVAAASKAPPTAINPAWIDPRPRGLRMLGCLLFRPGRIGLSGMQGWRVLGVVGLLWLVDHCERLRLHLGGRAVR